MRLPAAFLGEIKLNSEQSSRFSEIKYEFSLKASIGSVFPGDDDFEDTRITGMILDDGRERGNFSISIQDDEAHVNWINLNQLPGTVSPADIRGLIRDFKSKFPQIRQITGFRISGAKSNIGPSGLSGIRSNARISLNEQSDNLIQFAGVSND